ncbi:MAG: C25 family cysteine peptidase [Acidobacteriota bacterium]
MGSRRVTIGQAAAFFALLVCPAFPGRGAAATLPPGVTLVEETTGSVLLDVKVPEPRLRRDLPGGVRLELPGYGVLWETGRPALPQARVRLAVADGQPARIEIRVLDQRRLVVGSLASPPSVLPVADPEDPAGPGTMTFRRGRLARGIRLPYPGAVAIQASRGRLRELPVLTLRLTPVRLLALPGTLDVARHFQVRVTWGPGAGAALTAPGGQEGGDDASRFSRIYAGAVANGRATLSLRRPVGGRPPGPAAAGSTAGSGTASAELSPATSGSGAQTAASMHPALPVTPVAGSAVYRLEISEDGLYGLDGAWLAANAPDLVGRPVGQLFMAANGTEIPIRVLDDDGDSLVSPGDRIEFFGEEVDEDPLDPDAWQQGDFTDTRPYLLGAALGTRLRTSTAVSGAPASGFPAVSSFTETVRLETDNIFLTQVPDDLAERWYDEPFLKVDPDNANKSVLSRTLGPVPTPGLDSAGTASLTVRMLGFISSGNLNGYHRTRLLVNGTQVDQADWDGFQLFTQGVDSPSILFSAGLLSATSSVTVEMPLDRVVNGTPVTRDLIVPDRADLTYPRLLAAAGDRLLLTVPNAQSTLTVTGFTSSDVAAFDVTPAAAGVASPLHLAGAQVSGAGPFSVTFEIDPADVTGPQRRIAVSSGPGLQVQPQQVSLFAPADDLAGGGADWLVVGPRFLLDRSPGSALSDLVALRQSQGLLTRVVDLEDVYDAFSYGLEDPQAIRDLVRWALTAWSPAPTHLLLVGDASLDYKNAFGYPNRHNLLPTFMGSVVNSPVLSYFSEDNRFAAVLGADDLPDLFLGRLPVHDAAEAGSTFAKIVAYAGLSSGPAWTRRGLFLSDADDSGFELSQRQAINRYIDGPQNPGLFGDPNGPCFSSGTCHNDPLGPGPLFQTASMQALLDRNPGTLAADLAPQMNQWIRDGIDSGDAVTFYLGHGGFQVWGRDATIFRNRSVDPDDVDLLTNGASPTFMVNINCITGGFHADDRQTQPDLTYSLAEDLLVTSGRGVIGALAPSHLTFVSILGFGTDALWDRLLGEERDRLLGALNVALRLKLDTVGAQLDLRTFAFLGDPATRLILPDPEPPGSVTATAGNGMVSLAWTAGPDAVTFRVERSQVGPTGPFTTISAPGWTATTLLDTGVVNATTYYYRVFGQDGNGMESVPSNRNLDCPAGPDCVTATPLNPDPPGMPSGFTAVDARVGGRLNLGWLPNPEGDLALYRVRYGTVSGSYPLQATFPAAATGGALIGLANDQPVFLILEAENTSGLSSASTAEVQAVPRLVLGIAPPRSILDLMVIRDGNDALLQWSPIQEDIYTDPTTVQDYPVYASTASPLFPVDSAHQIGITPAGSAPSFRHVGGAAGPELRFYLVQSRDSNGFASAAGLALPAAIADLRLERLAPASLRLSWSPVTTDFDGAPLVVDHYDVYGSGAPFSRADLSLMTPLRSGVTATTVDLLESEGAFFTVVAVDGRGQLSPY